MKKIPIISLLIVSTLISDSFLGKPITANNILKPQHQIKSYSKEIKNPPIKKIKHSKRKFKKNNHRYDKRYRNFNYSRYGYYNNDDYYYGYYDTKGYFFNNIFFTYNSRYNYNDRVNRRGCFRPNYHHNRVREYHRISDWNRVHFYRERENIEYGYYGDRPSYNNNYNEYRSSYYEPPRREESHYNTTTNIYINSNHRDSRSRNRRGYSRMRTRNSSNLHIQLSK